MIAYTVGCKEIYELLLDRQPPVCKLGAHPPTSEEPDGYLGGAVWRTAEEALQYLAKSNCVSALCADAVYLIELPGTWEECTRPGISYAYLLKDSPLVCRLELTS